MAWYYAEGGERRGPIDDRAFQQLVAQGTVGPDTLVWREGMADWQAYGDVALSRPPATEATPAEPQQMVELGAGASDLYGEPAAPQRPAHTAPVAGAGLGGMRMCSACGNTFPAEELVELEGRSICGACKPSFLQHLREGNTLSYGMIYAGFWPRFGAYIVDSIIVGLPILVLYGLMFGVILSDPAAMESDAPPPAFIGVMVLIVLYALIVPIGYYTYFLGKSGATPGKKMLSLRVVKDDGTPITYMRALGRSAFLLFVGSQCYGIINIISAIMVATDDEKRSIHDHICSTRVIRN